MASGLIPGTPVGQLFSRSSQPTTPTLQDVQENNLGGVSSGHAIPQLHPENSHKAKPLSLMGCFPGSWKRPIKVGKRSIIFWGGETPH